MHEFISNVMPYNRSIADSLRQTFTPICESFYQKINSLTEAEIQNCVDDLVLCLLNYQDSKYDKYLQSAPEILSINKSENNKRGLTHNEKQYFASFLRHLNEVALTKPYNIIEHITGRFSQYLWSPLQNDKLEANNHAAESLVVPVGEYAFDHYLLMLLTSKLLASLTDKLAEETECAEANNWEVLSVETSRGRKKAEKLTTGGKPHINSVLDTFKEGIQSFQSTISSLTAKKIPGLEFDSLIELIIKGGLPQQIAAKVPFNYTIPSIRQGIYHEHIFNYQVGLHDKLSFSKAFLEYCSTTQKIYKESRLVVDGKRNPGLLGTGCPVAQRLSGYEMIGINYIAKAYYHLYKHLSKVINLQHIKDKLMTVTLTNPQPLLLPLIKPDEFKANNLTPEIISNASKKIGEVTALQQLTNEILTFWYGQIPVYAMPTSDIRNRWFARNNDFDAMIEDKFALSVKTVKGGKFLDCNRTPSQTLALIILLDQFSRNIYRDSADAYAADEIAIKLAFEVISSEHDKLLSPVCRWFLYMPLQHSEDLAMQPKSIEVFKQLLQDVKGTEEKEIFSNVLRYAKQHHQVIEHFGRFPHRNKLLGRVNTKEEERFLSLLEPGLYYTKNYFDELKSDKQTKVKNDRDQRAMIKSSQLNENLICAFMLCGALCMLGGAKDNKILKSIGFILLLSGLYLVVNTSRPSISGIYQAGLGLFKRTDSLSRHTNDGASLQTAISITTIHKSI